MWQFLPPRLPSFFNSVAIKVSDLLLTWFSQNFSYRRSSLCLSWPDGQWTLCRLRSFFFKKNFVLTVKPRDVVVWHALKSSELLTYLLVGHVQNLCCFTHWSLGERQTRNTWKCVLFLWYPKFHPTPSTCQCGLSVRFFSLSPFLKIFEHCFKLYTKRLVPSRTNVVWKEGSRARGTVRRPGVKQQNVLSQLDLDLETTTQTFMLRARPSPLCDSASVKRSPPWWCDESKKALFSGDLASFLCAHASSYECMSFCSHMSSCRIRTWVTSELRPTLRTLVHGACAHSGKDGVSNDPETFSYVMQT